MFTVEYAKDLTWSNPEHTTFDCVAKFAEFSEEIPFACVQSDKYAHSQELWQRATAGEFGSIAEYVEVQPATEPQPVVAGAQTL
jgi:hypothetical protein